MKTRISAAALLIALLWCPGPAHAQSALPGYHSFEAMSAALSQLVSAHPKLLRVTSVGKSIGGRDIWVAEVGNPVGSPMETRPALLVAATLEGNHLVGGEITLAAIRYLLEGYATDADIRKRLDEHVFYFFPRLNPDGAEAAFASLRTGSRTNLSAYDDDNDGRMDEDGPDDLNGDGWITAMRVPDPKGPYMIDPKEPRLVRKADASKGEAGGYAVYREGLDRDGDGFYNEDPVGGVDLNRNFQHTYPYYEAGAGIHMVSERESRAMMDFMIAHRNIALVMVFGDSDNLMSPPNQKGELETAEANALFSFADASVDDARTVGVFESPRPRFGFGFGGRGGGGQASQGGRPSSGQRPATTVDRDDLAYFTTISEKYREITGLKSVPALRKPAGALFEYGYYQFGVPSFSTPGWAPDVAADSAGASAGASAAAAAGASGPAPARGPRASTDKPSVDQRLLKWMDANSIDGFVPWSPYTHPTLGAVEIGGFRPYRSENPPSSMVQELGPKHGQFLVYLASLYADVRIAKTEVSDEGGGVFRIKAEIENAGFLPTASAQGVRARSVKPTMVQLGIDPENLLSGSAKTSFFQATDGSGRRQSFEWIIRGKQGERIELRVVSQKGGSDTASLTLR